jgi:hypothetical protein
MNFLLTRRAVVKNVFISAGAGVLALKIFGESHPFSRISSSKSADEFEEILEAVDLALTDDFLPSRTNTEWAFSELSRTRPMIRAVSVEMGIDVDGEIEVGGELIAEYDWESRTYAELLALEEEIYDALGEIPESNYGGVAGDGLRRLLAKILAALGIRDAWNAFKEVLEELGESILEAIGRAIRNKEWKKLRKLIGILIDLITSSAFKERLAHRIGEAAAARIIGRILAKALPIVGWAILIAEFVWAIAEQFLRIAQTEFPGFVQA